MFSEGSIQHSTDDVEDSANTFNSQPGTFLSSGRPLSLEDELHIIYRIRIEEFRQALNEANNREPPINLSHEYVLRFIYHLCPFSREY